MKPAKVMPPVPTLSVPLVISKAPEAPRVSIITASMAPLKVTLTLAGKTTEATLAKSGTAPPAQLAASNQLPVAPPTHVTELKRVMLA